MSLNTRLEALAARIGEVVKGKANASHTHPVTDLTATGRTAANFLRGDNTWGTPPNTTYPLITQVEAESPASTVARLVSGQRLNQAFQSSMAEREKFDLASAKPQYGLWIGGASTTRVMQSISVSHQDSGYIMSSYALTGTTGARETTLVTLHSAAGRMMGEMRFIDAGHGTGVFMEFSDNGDMFVWLSYTDHSVASGIGRYNYVRVPWSSGTNHTWLTAATYKVNALSRSTYLTAHLDGAAGIVGVREDIGGNQTYTVHSLSNLIAGAWGPLKTMTYTYPAGTFIQGWAYLEGFWYIYSGSAESNVPYSPAEVIQVNADTGTLVRRRSLEAIRASVTGNPLFGSSEPEGFTVARGLDGAPVLVCGISAGLEGGRSHSLWSLGDGASPFQSELLGASWNAGGTSWTSYPLIITNSAATLEADPSQAFEVRRMGDYLEMRGRINVLMTRGVSTPIGSLRPGFYNPNRHLRGLASKSSVTVSPDVSVRVEINVSGGLSVFASANGTGEAGWVDFTGFRVPLL